jgi:ubiquinone/menaquinone biosynthesis C-methylase UbiE
MQMDFLPGEAHFGSRWRERVTRSFLKPDIEENVLDAGCGCGAITMAIAADVSRITGVDISAAAIELGQESAKSRGIRNIHFRVGDLARLSALVERDSFDSAYCLDALEHAENFPVILSELFKVLRPGGRLFLMVPTTEGHGHFQHDLADVERTAKAQGWEIAVLGRLSPPPVTRAFHRFYLRGRKRIAGSGSEDVDVCHETKTFAFAGSPPWYVRVWAAVFPFLWRAALLADRSPYRPGGDHIAGLLKRPPAGGAVKTHLTV